MGSFMRKENILNGHLTRSNTTLRKAKKSKSTIKVVVLNNDKSKVVIDGFSIHRNRRVTICATCVKTVCTNKKHVRRLCTSAGYWFDLKKKYNYKIMGHYRLSIWIRKRDVELTKSLQS